MVEGGTSALAGSRILAFERIRDTERIVEEKLRFQVIKPGKQTLVLHAMCDSYQGLDQRIELTFTAQTEEQGKRDIIVHPEDEELDAQPTLFQQFMGDLGRQDDESEDEEEEKTKTKKKAIKVKKEGDEDEKGEDEEDEEDEKKDDDKKESAKKKKKPVAKKKEKTKKTGDSDDSDSSSSSSSSDSD